MYGVASKKTGFIAVSKTEKGAKNFASRHGYTRVARLSDCGDYIAQIVAEKINGKWVKI